jgi:hypothetical protein
MEEDMASRSHPYADAPSAPLKASEVLERAAALIEPEGAWTQRAYARNALGKVVSSDDADAVCWCAFGAVNRVRRPHHVAPSGFLDDLFERANGSAFEKLNDTRGRTQAEVIAALRKAAELARSEGQ